ncbi:hypothetical protein ACEWY4_005623 [Coilia grayii]|uniref:CD109 molecule n=1 Tax=Coilia grayii TaxID=363190 RepID=A0ABD1KJ89_9TELE
MGHKSSFRLVVKGYEDTRLLFTENTTLKLGQNTVSTLVWTHRAIYRPNQTVKIQVQSVYVDGTPYRGKLDIVAQDPTGNVIQQWRSLDSLQGMGMAELTLPHNPPCGIWAIQATPSLLPLNAITFHFWSVFHLKGSKSNNLKTVADAEEKYSITFSTHPHLLKPSLTFSTQVKISRVDEVSMSVADGESGVRVSVTQLRARRMELEDSGPKGRGDSGVKESGAVVQMAMQTISRTLPEDGKIPIQFHVQEEADTIVIQVTFMSAEQILVLHRTSASPSGPYMQIYPPSQFAQIGDPLQLNIESVHSTKEFHYVVMSRGQVVAAGKETSSSVLLTPTQSWASGACVTAFYQLPSGEIFTDTVNLPRLREQVCNLAVLTDASFQNSGQTGALKYVVGIAVPESHGAENTSSMKTDFSDPWIWMKTDMSDISATSLLLETAAAFSLGKTKSSVRLGDQDSAHVSRLKRMADDKPLTWSVRLPPSLIKGEEFILEVTVLNHLKHDTEVTVAVDKNQMFEFVSGDVSTPNKQILGLKALGQAGALFPIRPLVLGEVPFSIHVMSSDMQNYTAAKLIVLPEGHQQTFSQSLFLDIPPLKSNLSKEVRFTLPGGVVPGTPRAHVAVTGDILALSIAGLDSLVQMPVGCGEQNMVHFAPSVYVLRYLSQASHTNNEIAQKALAYMKEGYNRELLYLRNDGSFSGFGQSDASGSTWLTAFVLRCFLQARAFMEIDQSMLSKAFTWLADQQTPKGSFTEPGRVLHTQLQGGLDGPVSLTAYVLVTLLEDKTQTGFYPGNVSKAQEFLEAQLANGISSNYSLSLVAYALTLANSPKAEGAINQLMRRADIRDGVVFWTSGDADLTDSWQPSSACIEMAAYVLLTLFKQGSIVESIELMKWLSRQRGPLGGFGSTQDTIIALEALSFYAVFSGSDAINLNIKVTSKISPKEMSFKINSTNYLNRHQQEIPLDTSVYLDILLEGRGFALFQMNIFYNLESLALSQTARHASSHEAFGLRVEVSDDEAGMGRILLAICTKLLDSQSVEQTGMAMLDVQILSGFMLRQSSFETNDLVKKVELLPGRIVLYLDSLGKTEKCVNFPLVREFKVAHVQPALIQVFDYYEPRRRAERLYHSKVMQDLTVCTFCGANCNHCWGKTGTTSDTPTIHSTKNTIYGLGCLLLFVHYMIMK